LLREWGLLAANTVLALSDFDPGSVPSTHYWDLRDSLVAVESCLEFVEDRENRLAVERLMEGSDAVIEKFEQLPQQVIHQDLNDFNVLISEVSTEARVTGLLDVGDTLFAPRLSELIVASAYAMLRQPQPLSAVDRVIDGYAEILPLPDAEYDIVRQLSGLRLCVNATTWTKRASLEGTMYGQRRMAETWPTIRALAKAIG
jgi:Ser/Thr protein kinase RdoA (MazF antagonist)